MNAEPMRLRRRGLYWAALLLILVGLAYSNSLNAIWALDDDPNILQNPQVHIKDLKPETLFRTFFSPLHIDKDGQPGLNRPLAHLSLAVNWYFGESSPVGYRLVNILIHFLVAFVLFHVIRDLLDTPNMRGQSFERKDSIAMVAAALWALNPIQTQAVVYIVQRMASLACLFYILAIWCYVRGRAQKSISSRAVFYAFTFVCFFAGLGSKENAIMLPAALLLMEFTFFQDWSQPVVRRRFNYVLFFVICLLLISLWLFSIGKMDAWLDYSIRLFTPWERLLTQPRIIFFYISQAFYPVPGRLSITHDVELSRTLFEPWTTLPALLGVVSLISFGVLQMRKRPMLSFAILFFFLNHVIESSAIGLELIYEHRNYLPSLFLFAPIAIGFQRLIDHYSSRGSGFHRVVGFFVILLIAGFGTGTYIRNMAWRDPKTFWEDAAHKAPFSMRPLHNLAYYYYEKRGDYKSAHDLYQKALALRSYNRQELSSAHVNLANYYFRQGDFVRASEHLSYARAAFPGFELVRYLQAFVFFRAGKTEKALDAIQSLAAEKHNYFDAQYLLAQILFKMGRTSDALDQLHNCLRIKPDSEDALFMAAIATNSNGDYATAEELLKVVLARSPGNKHALLWMIDCRLQSADEASAEAYARQFVEGIKADRIERSIEKLLVDGYMPEDSRNKLLRWMLERSSDGNASGKVEDAGSGFSAASTKSPGS
jgi:tetratricopeptide (TPR) repeat protein